MWSTPTSSRTRTGRCGEETATTTTHGLFLHPTLPANTTSPPLHFLHHSHNVAVTLHNIACNRSCRSEMVNRGVLACLLSLSAPPPPQAPPATDGGQAPEEDGRCGGGDGHQQHLKPPAPEQGQQEQQEQQAERARLLECVAVTLQCLSLNVGTRRRTIQEGAVRVVLNLLEQQPAAGGPRALQACAQALHAFSAFDDCAGPLLKHQAVPALVKLSGAAGALLAARESYVAAFCNLLSLEGNHAVVLDQVRSAR